MILFTKFMDEDELIQFACQTKSIVKLCHIHLLSVATLKLSSTRPWRLH